MNNSSKKTILNWIKGTKRMSSKQIVKVLDSFNTLQLIQIADKLTAFSEVSANDFENVEESSDEEIEHPIYVPKLNENNTTDIAKFGKGLSQIKDLLINQGPVSMTRKGNPGIQSFCCNTIDSLTGYIKHCMSQADFCQYSSLLAKMDVAIAMDKLMHHLVKTHVNGVFLKTKKDCYPYFREQFNIAESTYTHYQSFHKFLKDYPRFQHSSLSFSDFKNYSGAIRKWFGHPASLNLPPSDFTSACFWTVDLSTELCGTMMQQLTIDEEM